jgi:hypothetical protein
LRKLPVFLAMFALAAVWVTGTALAAKPGPGGSTGTGLVFVPNPVQSSATSP